MAVNNTRPALHRVLFVVVACSREPSRALGFSKTVKSVARVHKSSPFARNLVLFDNASVYHEPLKYWQAPAMFVFSEENIGYWSALYWTLQNCENIFDGDFDYIHPVESDTLLFKLDRLAEAVRFLYTRQSYHVVRTQEFSVKWRQFFLKGKRSFLKVNRSIVAPYHGVTGEPVKFEEVEGFNHVFSANWHAKLPALHRISSIRQAFSKLKNQEVVTELDFMRTMADVNDKVGVLDGGVWRLQQHFRKDRKGTISGSYSNKEELEKVNYRASRCDRIETTFPKLAKFNIDLTISAADINALSRFGPDMPPTNGIRPL